MFWTSYETLLGSRFFSWNLKIMTLSPGLLWRQLVRCSHSQGSPGLFVTLKVKKKVSGPEPPTIKCFVGGILQEPPPNCLSQTVPSTALL